MLSSSDSNEKIIPHRLYPQKNKLTFIIDRPLFRLTLVLGWPLTHSEFYDGMVRVGSRIWRGPKIQRGGGRKKREE